MSCLTTDWSNLRILVGSLMSEWSYFSLTDIFKLLQTKPIELWVPPACNWLVNRSGGERQCCLPGTDLWPVGNPSQCVPHTWRDACYAAVLCSLHARTKISTISQHTCTQSRVLRSGFYFVFICCAHTACSLYGSTRGSRAELSNTGVWSAHRHFGQAAKQTRPFSLICSLVFCLQRFH